MTGTILALDPATETGWAVSPDEGGVWDLKPARGSSPGMRFLLLRGRLHNVYEAHPDLFLVAYERPHYRGGAPTEVLAGLTGAIQAWCAEYDVEHMAVHTRTLKKYATGKGNCSKADMVAAAKDQGWTPVDHNHADALHLLAYAHNAVGTNKDYKASGRDA